jgi:inorganic pyrophosphatase
MRKNVRIHSHKLILATILWTLYWSVVGYPQDTIGHTQNLNSPDSYTIVSDKSFLTGYEPVNRNGDINVVVEIPTGTIAKWEVVKPSGDLKWGFESGMPRMVRYLGYPGNYGMVPRTLLPKELGGDGDPLDVIVLAPPVARGSVVRARLIGVLKMLDDGKQDDKLIAVLWDTPFFEVTSLKQLDEKFNGVTDIIEIWFSNYKGADRTQSNGFGNEKEAKQILESAITAFGQSQEK